MLPLKGRQYKSRFWILTSKDLIIAVFWCANCLDHDDQVSWTERRRILAALVKKMQKVLKTGQPCPDLDVESPKMIIDDKYKIYLIFRDFNGVLMCKIIHI